MRSRFSISPTTGLEGIVSKRADSVYRSGPTIDWLKTTSFVISEYELMGLENEPGKAGHGPFGAAWHRAICRDSLYLAQP